MPSLNLDIDYFEHRKTKRLIGQLGRGAEVLPLRVWCFAAKYHPVDGKLTGYSAQEIESMVGWWGKAGECIAALVNVGFLVEIKNGWRVHEWKDHEGHLTAYHIRAKKGAKARWAKLAGDASSKLEANDKQCPIPTKPTKPFSSKKTGGSFGDRVLESMR